MTAPSRRDATIARAAADGNLAAFEELVRRYQDELYRQAVGYLGCPSDAQDAVQDALIRAFERLATLRDMEKVEPWLRTLVRNRCLNLLRSRQRRLDAASQAEPATAASPPEAIGTDMSAADMLRALPEPSAAAFRLHYLEGRSVAEVARALCATSGSVKQRLYRARQQLREEAVAMATTDADRLPDDFPARVITHLIEAGRRDRLHMRLDQAREHLRQALEVESDHPEALLELGRCYDPFGWPGDDQFQVLERAARVSTDSLEVACELAIACRRPGREAKLPEAQDRAVELCQRRLADAPEDLVALKAMARLRSPDAPDKALPLLQKAVEQAPSDTEANFWLARTFDRLDRRSEAMPLYERICADNDSSVWTYFAHRQLAIHLAFRVGAIEQAVEHMEEVWRLTGKATEAGNLIYFLGACERFDRILQLYEEVQRDGIPRVHATAGIAYRQANRLDEATAAWEQALEAAEDPPFRAEASLHLARCLHGLGHADRAAVYVEEGLHLDLASRRTLASGPETPFWRVWTRWLVECLQALDQEGAPVAGLLKKARQQATS